MRWRVSVVVVVGVGVVKAVDSGGGLKTGD